MSNTELIGVAFISVYVDDFEKAYKFYTDVLGMTKSFDMGSLACFLNYGKEGKEGMYLQGGNDKADFKESSSRPAFVLSVKSANELHAKLLQHNIRMIHDKPMDMGQGDFWFQCYDPCGNIIEFLGGK